MNRKQVAFWIFLLALLTAPTWFYPYFPRFDSGAYLMGSRCLAAGQWPKVLSHPLQPPATYPPVTMLLLAPIDRLFGGNTIALRLALSACWLLAVFLLFRLWDREPPQRRIWFAVLAGSGSIWLYCGRIQSEIPYLLVSVAALAALDRWKRDERFWGGGWGPAALALAALAGLTRQIGLMVATGGAIYLAFDRRRWRRGLAAGALILAIGLTPGVMLYSITQPGQFAPDKSSLMRRDGWNPEKGQISPVSRELLGRIKGNVTASLTLAPASLFVLDFAPAARAWRWSLLPLSLLLILGYFRCWRGGPTAAEFYLPCYLALLWITPWLVETRFFTVLVPWLVLYLYEGTEWLALRIAHREPWARRFATAVVLLLTGVNLVLIGQYKFVDRWSRIQNDEAEAYQLYANWLDPRDVVLTHDPFAFFMMTGIHAMSYTTGEQKYQPSYRLPAYLQKGGRVNAVLYPDADAEAVQKLLQDQGWEVKNPQSQKHWNFGRLDQQKPL